MRIVVLSLMTVALPMTGGVTRADAVIVYDSIDPEYNFGGHGLNPSAVLGEIVEFSGAARVLTRFEIAIAGANPPPFDAFVELELGLFALNEATGLPDEVLWLSGTQSVPLPARVTQVLSFDLPHIEVGDAIAWGVLPSDSNLAPVLLSSREIHTGSLGAVIRAENTDDLANAEWQAGGFRFINGYEVRFTAVPSPTAAVQTVVLGLIVASARRRVASPL